ncbi:MAG: hypothetical protein Q9207_007077, partial [Kuettlingeria erythrocarpa]
MDSSILYRATAPPQESLLDPHPFQCLYLALRGGTLDEIPITPDLLGKDVLLLEDNSAPALEIVKLHETNFANSFAEKSPYRGPPTAELETAWEELWD